MSQITKRILALLGLLTLPLLALSEQGRQVEANLISEVTAIEAGKPFWVALKQDIAPEWHTYWRNPGDSGAATTLNWQLPAGFTAGEIQWPVPERLPYGPLMNFGYSNTVVFPVQITPPASLPDGDYELKARGRWLVCKDICIPETAELTLTFRMGTPALAETATLFAEARARLPVDAGLTASWQDEGDYWSLLIPDMAPDTAAGNAETPAVDYFPYTEGVMDNPAPQTITLNPDGLGIRLRKGYDFTPDKSLAGIVVVREQGLTSVYHIDPVATGATASPAGSGNAMPLWQAVLFALLGGMILNLMPCVFPVLSIKVLSLVRQAGGDRRQVRLHGWVYGAGVVLSFIAIAAVLIGLRAGGAQIGWGFQLQSPVVIGLLVYLFFLIGLNLSGWFEVGNRLMSAGQSLTEQEGLKGSFFTGV
ncbi:MAG: hypothetical protein KDI36_18930, partial [Pseudomonadales bacterium]|nr:hypothetical protein [Pseudomonadales bacterium]